MSTTRLNFLFTTFDGGGNVAPFMSVVEKLVRRGHRVRVLSDEITRLEVEAAGAALVTWQRAPNKIEHDREASFKDWELSTQDTVRFLVEQFMCGLALPFAEDVIAELKREPADLVVTWDGILGVLTGCEAHKQKVATLSTAISTPPLPGIPPMGSGLKPPQTAQERAHIDKAIEHMWSSGLPALNTARVSLGLAPLKRVLDQFEIADLRLLGTARAFDFPTNELPRNVRYVGPLIRDPVWAKPWQSPWPETDVRPLVLVAFSSGFQNHAACLQRIVDASASLPVRVLVTLGNGLFEGEVKPAANTAIVLSAPHHHVMRGASLVVTHGGHGTVMTALIHRLPMLVVPHGRDQEDDAIRITERGAGLSMPNTASVQTMHAAFARLLNEPIFKAGARKLGDAVAAEVQHSTIIQDLEALASD